jgi:hypothetical protein
MTYNEAINILKNPKDYTAKQLNLAIEVVKRKMFER